MLLYVLLLELHGRRGSPSGVLSVPVHSSWVCSWDISSFSSGTLRQQVAYSLLSQRTAGPWFSVLLCNITYYMLHAWPSTLRRGELALRETAQTCWHHSLPLFNMNNEVLHLGSTRFVSSSHLSRNCSKLAELIGRVSLEHLHNSDPTIHFKAESV